MEPRKRTLFVCVGNLCRSPMAEAFARVYGSDVLVSSSAGLSPATVSGTLTRAVLKERNIDLGEHLPKSIHDLDLSQQDLIVNMSGYRLPSAIGGAVETWQVRDPIGLSEQVYREVRDHIEMLVMGLILRLRTGKFDSKAASS